MMYKVLNAATAFPGLYENQHVQLGKLRAKFGHMLLADQIIFLSLLARRAPGPVVEIGTYTGRTTYNMAINTDRDIYTIDMVTGGFDKYSEYVVGEAFAECGFSHVHFILGDSRKVDIPVEPGTAGLVVIDGGHSYLTVKSDSERAFSLIHPEGMIVWDDYHGSWPGVVKAVNEYVETHTLVHLEQEGFVVHCPTLVIDKAFEKV